MRKILLLFLLVPQLSIAQTINVEAQSTVFGYLANSEHENVFAEGQISFDFRLGETGMVLYLKPAVRYGSRFSGSTFTKLYEEDLRPIFNLEEGYIGIEQDKYHFRLGKLKHDNCLSDKSPVCPSDSFSPKDFIDPFGGFDERIGLPAISFKIGDSRQYLMAVSSFGNSFSRMPVKNSRWFSAPEELVVSQDREVSQNITIAGKMSFMSSSLGLVVSRGQDHSPYLRALPPIDTLSFPGLLFHYPTRTSAIVQAELYRKVTARLSGGYVHEEGFESIQYSLEVEDQRLESWGTLSILGGLIGEISLSNKQGFIKSDQLNWRRGFNNSFFGGFEQTREPWIIHLGIISTLEKDTGYAINPKIMYTSFCDVGCSFFEIELSALFLGGESNNLFGQYRRNDRIGLDFLIGF